MKKIILAMAVLVTSFMSCSLDSRKVDPNIIGTAYLQYDSTNNLCYAVIDSIEHPVSEVFIPRNNGYSPLETSQIMHLDEVNVTLFTSPHLKGVNAIVGKQTEAQIAEMCKKSIETKIFVMSVLIFIIILVGWVFFEIEVKEKKHHGKKT